ncbi:MAG TPA: enoyl-CoA hydratase-related protein [Sphingobium sp.]|uniref:enoyl-CoA hydratase-related protein n=1 Tax=Sphingobium sp. TaxID=1912891 RepID=UPI002ED17FC9
MEHLKLAVDAERAIGTIVLDRSDCANAINDQTVNEISEAYRSLDADERVKVIVLSGAGKGFCSGHQLGGSPTGQPLTALEDVEILLRQNNRLLDIYNGNTPMIAKVHGYCLGAAVELVLLCDLSIASADSRFAHPAIRGAGGSPNALLYPFALGFSKAKEYLWVTPELSGTEAAEWQLVNRAVPAGELDAWANKWASRIASMPVENIRIMRRGLRRLQDMAGYREASEIGADLDAFGHSGPATKQWKDTVAEVGLKEAVRRRDSAFL